MIPCAETGMMEANVGVISNVAAPVGVGIHEYLETQYVMIPDLFA